MYWSAEKRVRGNIHTYVHGRKRRAIDKYISFNTVAVNVSSTIHIDFGDGHKKFSYPPPFPSISVIEAVRQ